jgi:hypothetical protein
MQPAEDAADRGGVHRAEQGGEAGGVVTGERSLKTDNVANLMTIESDIIQSFPRIEQETKTMPIHDWTRVPSGIFHHFHERWIAALCDVFNTGGLPKGYYTLADQVVGGSGLATATAEPRTRFVHKAEPEQYAARANRILIRHPLGDVIAVLEIVSPGNKDSRNSLRALVDKAVGFLRQGIHLLLVDLFPPSNRDPQGIHKAIWDEIREEPFELPADKPLTLVAYSAGPTKMAYVEPVAVGDVLPDMPVFLTPDFHAPAPLEATYMTTWEVCPEPMRELLEPPAS